MIGEHLKEYEAYDALKRLWKTHIEKINQQRNAVAHSGEFRSRSIAEKVVADTHSTLLEIMELYGFGGELKPFSV